MLSSRLFTFITVYDEESISGAATKLNLTQPAITNQLNLLEQKLGCPLFFRSKGQLTFTPEGELVADYAKKLRAIHTQMLSELSEETTSTHIRIGVNKTIDSDSILSNTIAKYSASDPNVTFSLHTDTTDSLYKKLNNFELDALILASKNELPDFEYFPLVSEDIFCIVNSGHPLALKSSVTLDDLMSHRIILRTPQSSTRQNLEYALSKVGKSIEDMDVVVEIDSKNALVNFIKQNVGISLLSKSNCVKYQNRGGMRILPIDGVELKKEIHLLCRKDYKNKQLLTKFQHFYNLSNY